jgi:hypothetical protein
LCQFFTVKDKNGLLNTNYWYNNIINNGICYKLLTFYKNQNDWKIMIKYCGSKWSELLKKTQITTIRFL